MSKNKRFDDDEYIPRSKRLEYEDDFDDDDDDEIQYEQLFGTYDDDDDDDDDVFGQLKAPRENGRPSAQRKTYSDSDRMNHQNQVRWTSASKKKRKRKSKHPIRKFFLIVLVCVLSVYLIGVGTVYSVLGNVNYTEKELTWEDSIASEAPNWELADSLMVENILLLGIDGNENTGRSDTMIIVSIDRLKRQIKLTSLLRDLYVTIPGRGHNRLNAAYSFGGAPLLMQTIECNFRIKIDQYICVNFSSFENIINEIGGVTINLTDAEAAYINKTIPGSLTGGEQRLNGAQAVYFARIRKIGTDFGRTSRQRTLLEALMNECKTLEISQLIDLIGLISPNLDTNISRLKLANTAIEGVSCWFNEIEECSIPVKDGYSSRTIDGMAVLVPNLEKNCTVLHEFVFGKVPKSLS